MPTNFKVIDYKDGKLITLSTGSTRRKMLYFFYAFIFFATAVVFGCFALYTISEFGFFVLSLAGFIAFSIIFYRFLNKAVEKEKLFVNKERLEILIPRLFKTERESFLIADISDFRLLDRDRYEPHPLKSDTFDYLGFQTEQQVIQDLHSEGRVSFVYHGRQVRFGKELASWEYDDLEVLLYELTGNDFRYTDAYEKEHFPQEEAGI